MSEIDSGRLGMFAGTLLALGIGFQTVSWFTGLGLGGALGLLYMFTPMIATLVVVYRYDCSLSELGVRTGRVRWLGGAVAVSLSVVGLTVAVSLAVPGVSLDPARLETLSGPTAGLGLLVAFGITVAFGATVGAVMGFGEELGWRGYLLWELAPLGFWKASLAIGVVWGVWHLPGVIAGGQYPSYTMVGVPVMIGATVALSPIYTYLVWRADSVFAAALFHGIFNGASMTVIPLLTADTEVLTQLVATTIGAAGMIACGLLTVIIAVHGTPDLDRTRLAPSVT
jgi:membrane protease YdiL (CAAX protease family)